MKIFYTKGSALAAIVFLSTVFSNCSKTSNVEEQKSQKAEDEKAPATIAHNKSAVFVTPYKDSTANVKYNLLFCDNPALGKTQTPDQYPYNVLFSETSTADNLQKVASDSTADTRARILACNQLLSKGVKPKKKELLGVVVEIGRENGLDALAAYKDGTACFVSQAEKILTINKPDPTSKKLVDDLLSKSGIVVNQIQTTDNTREKYPIKGDGKVTFLLSDGTRSSAGPISVIFSNLSGGSIKKSAAELLKYMLDKSNPTDKTKK